MTGHEGHDIAPLSARRITGLVGKLVCLTCSRVLADLTFCGKRTRKGRPCAVAVRVDLGHTTCWSHGEGAGRTSTPRERRAS